MGTPASPTRVRYFVVAGAALMSVLLYLDRFCISFAEMYIQEDLGLTNTQVGWMLSAFFWTYALGQVPAGWLTDRFGSRIMLTLYVLMWSLFTGWTGAVSVFAALLALRLGFGFAQAGAYPTASSIVSKWVPITSRGTASGIIACGGRVGGFLALFASGQLIVWLTPLSTPAELRPDSLLQPLLLSHQLQTADDNQEAEGRQRARCLARFSTAGQSLVAAQAAEWEAIEAARLTGESKPQTAATLPVVSDADRGLLVGELNQIILDPAMFSAEDLVGVPIEKEARRLAERDRGALSDMETQRLNRLILDALFRESLRKLYVAGWRPMMWIYGSLGLLVAALIWWSCRTTPAEHPACNAAEVELIAGFQAKPAKPATAAVGVPIVQLLTSRSMWLSCVMQWFTNVGWVFLMTWAPRYYSTAHQVSLEERAILVSIPPLIGWIGMLSGGTLTDLATRWWGLRWGRAVPMSFSRFLAMAAYLGCLFEPSVTLAVVLFSIVAFATDLGVAATWAFTQDVGGRQVGSILGWGNMWGNLGAAVTPPLLIWIIGDNLEWNRAFLACAAAFFLAGVSALGINATIPIVSQERRVVD
ncbi:MAG: MFS transporter [Pirellulaceae bacterium]|nr:MFS transporter [Pirellulaceae bacterium]